VIPNLYAFPAADTEDDRMIHSPQSPSLRKAEASSNNEDLARYYDSWAADYEQDSMRFGYHRVVAVMTAQILRWIEQSSGPILDIGAGTGLLGEMLNLLGYDDLVGIDLSEGMLGVARSKGVYKELKQMTIDVRMDFEDNAFAAVVAMGVFTAGCHMPACSFAELVRITRPGGHIIFTIRTEIPSYKGFKEAHASLETEGKWRLVETTKRFQSLPMENPDALIEVKAFQVLGIP